MALVQIRLEGGATAVHPEVEQDQWLAESGKAEPRVGQSYCTTPLSVAAEYTTRTAT